MEYLTQMFKVDEPTVNGRIYPRAEVEQAIETFMKSSAPLGELDHPAGLNVDLERVSHKVLDTYIDDDGNWMARVELLDTPMGEVFKGLIENNILPGLDPRSVGQVSNDFVVSDLQIVAIDAITEQYKEKIARQAEEKQKEKEATCSSTQESPSNEDGSQE